MLNNKKGIELSINFIVMLILAIATFAGGLAFAGKFFGHAQQMRASLDSQTEKQIEKLLDSGSPVVLPISVKEIYRNKFDTFGVGVLAKYTGDYTMTVSFNSAFKTVDKTPISPSAGDAHPSKWLQTPMTTQSLDKNEKGKFLIGVQVPKGVEKGTYIFTITVGFKKNSNSLADTIDLAEYDNPLQMIVKVP